MSSYADKVRLAGFSAKPYWTARSPSRRNFVILPGCIRRINLSRPPVPIYKPHRDRPPTRAAMRSDEFMDQTNVGAVNTRLIKQAACGAIVLNAVPVACVALHPLVVFFSTAIVLLVGVMVTMAQMEINSMKVKVSTSGRSKSTAVQTRSAVKVEYVEKKGHRRKNSGANESPASIIVDGEIPPEEVLPAAYRRR